MKFMTIENYNSNYLNMISNDTILNLLINVKNIPRISFCTQGLLKICTFYRLIHEKT